MSFKILKKLQNNLSLKILFTKKFKFYSSHKIFFESNTENLANRNINTYDGRLKIFKIKNFEEFQELIKTEEFELKNKWQHQLIPFYINKFLEILKNENSINLYSFEFIENINKNLHIILNNQEKLDETIKSLFILQDFIIKNDNLKEKTNFFMNVHFIKYILKTENDNYSYQLIKYILDSKKTNFLIEALELFSLKELLFFFKRINNLKNIETNELLIKTTQEIFSIKRFKEIDNFILFQHFIYSSKSIKDKFNFFIENSEAFLGHFFSLFQNENWPLYSKQIFYIANNLKFIYKNNPEKVLEELKKLGNSDICKNNEDGYHSFLIILKIFSPIFRLDSKKNLIDFEKIVIEFHENITFKNFYSCLLLMETLEYKIVNHKNIKKEFNLDNFFDFCEKKTEDELKNIFENLPYYSIHNLFEIIFENKLDQKQEVIKFKFEKTNWSKKLIIFSYICPKYLEFFDFKQEDFNNFKDNQYYLNKLYYLYHNFTNELKTQIKKHTLINFNKLLNLEKNDETITNNLKIIFDLIKNDTAIYLINQNELKIDFFTYFDHILKNNTLSTQQFIKLISNSVILGLSLSEKNINNFIKENYEKFDDYELSLLFKQLTGNKQLNEELIGFFQLYFLKNLDMQTPKILSNLLYAVSYIQPHLIKLHFSQPLFEIVKARAIDPEYSSIVSEHIFNQVKYNKKKFFTLKTPLNHLLIGMRKSLYYLTLMKFAKLIKSIEKFRLDLNSIFEELLSYFDHDHFINQVDSILNKDIVFVYTVLFNYGNEFNQKKIIKLLENQIKLKIENKILTNFEIGRIIHEYAVCFEYVIDEKNLMEILNSLLPLILKKDFFLIEKTKEMDIGLFMLIFYDLSFMQPLNFIDRFINVYENEINELLKKSIVFKQNLNVSLLHPNFAKNHESSRFKDVKKTFQDIHMIQLNRTLHNLYCFYKNKEQSSNKLFIEKCFDEIKKNPAFKNSIEKQTELELDSYFQKRVFYLINNVIFKNSETVIYEKEIDCFFVDIFLEKYKIVFECNGQQHYRGGKLKFNEKKKYEYLEKIHNLKICEIKIHEWKTKSNAEQEQYLRNFIFGEKINI